jgi:hypothetical protein
LFRIWMISTHLKFGICDSVLPHRYALCAMRYAIWNLTS